MKLKTTMDLFRRWILWGFGVLILTGCATSGPDRAAATSSTMRSTREALTDAKTQIDATLRALNDLVNQTSGDLRPNFKQFANDIPRNQAAADRVMRRADKMKAKGSEYFKKWETEIAQIHNIDIRNLSAERRSRALENYQRVTVEMQAAKESYRAFMSDLLDIQKYLSNDLTRAGVDSIAPTVRKANDHAGSVKERLDAAINQLDQVARELSASR